MELPYCIIILYRTLPIMVILTRYPQELLIIHHLQSINGFYGIVC